MGKPKTGIKVVDDAGGAVVDTVSSVSNGVNNVVSQAGNGINNALSQAGNGINNALTQVSNASTVTDTVRDLIAGGAKNIERNAADTINGLGLAVKGDFTGFDRTLINAFTMGRGGGILNPDDINNVTGTTTAEQQLTKKAEEAAARDAAAEVAKAQESAMADIAGVISGQIGARRRRPGREMTLLSGGYTPGSYTLLTGV